MAEAKLDGRSLVRRRAGLRLWLSAGWLVVLCASGRSSRRGSRRKDPLAQDLFLGRLPPFWVAGAEPGYWLGTDSPWPRCAEPHPPRRAAGADRGAGGGHASPA